MRDLRQVNNPHNDDKVIDACSIFGAMNIAGQRLVHRVGNVPTICQTKRCSAQELDICRFAALQPDGD